MGAVEEAVAPAAKTIARAGVVAIFAALLLIAQLWSSYRRDEREAAHMTKLEAAVDRFAEASAASARAMEAMRTDAVVGRESAVTKLAEQIKTCCSRRQ